MVIKDPQLARGKPKHNMIKNSNITFNIDSDAIAFVDNRFNVGDIITIGNNVIIFANVSIARGNLSCTKILDGVYINRLSCVRLGGLC